jgi:hypothetical protein
MSKTDKFQINIDNSIWLSVSEAAKLGGVQDKTIRRALKTHGALKFKVVKERYQIELSSLISYLHQNTKLRNKLSFFGLGQYVREWRFSESKNNKKNHLDS